MEFISNKFLFCTTFNCEKFIDKNIQRLHAASEKIFWAADNCTYVWDIVANVELSTNGLSKHVTDVNSNHSTVEIGWKQTKSRYEK